MSIQKSEWNTPQVKKNYTLKIQIRNILGEYPKIYKNNHFKMQKKSSAQMSRIYPWNNVAGIPGIWTPLRQNGNLLIY